MSFFYSRSRVPPAKCPTEIQEQSPFNVNLHFLRFTGKFPVLLHVSRFHLCTSFISTMFSFSRRYPGMYTFKVPSVA